MAYRLWVDMELGGEGRDDAMLIIGSTMWIGSSPSSAR